MVVACEIARKLRTQTPFESLWIPHRWIPRQKVELPFVEMLPSLDYSPNDEIGAWLRQLASVQTLAASATGNTGEAET